MVTEMLLSAVANTTASTAATQNGLDIGNFTGIAALVATAMTFALTYRHGSQSEQTRLARETWEKISENYHKFNEILEQYKEQREEELKREKLRQTGKSYDISITAKKYNLSDTKDELDKKCDILLDELDYYGFLEEHKQIKGKFTSYYTDRVASVYLEIYEIYKELFQKAPNLGYRYIQHIAVQYATREKNRKEYLEKLSKDPKFREFWESTIPIEEKDKRRNQHRRIMIPVIPKREEQ
jgi:hypothetical protein